MNLHHIAQTRRNVDKSLHIVSITNVSGVHHNEFILQMMFFDKGVSGFRNGIRRDCPPVRDNLDFCLVGIFRKKPRHAVAEREDMIGTAKHLPVDMLPRPVYQTAVLYTYAFKGIGIDIIFNHRKPVSKNQRREIGKRGIGHVNY